MFTESKNLNIFYINYIIYIYIINGYTFATQQYRFKFLKKLSEVKQILIQN